MDFEDILLSNYEGTRDTALRFVYTYVRARGAETWPKKKALLPEKNHKISCLKKGGKRVRGLEEHNSL